MSYYHGKKSIIDDEDIAPVRLQSLVEGVFAIAMTLLVFNINVPESANVHDSKELFLQLIILLPSLISFMVSFIILGMFWVAHHTEFHYIKKLDHRLIWLNIFYLLFICLFPFSAKILGKYPYNQTAVILYGINLIAVIFIHYIMWRHVKNNKYLLIENLDTKINTLVNILTFFSIAAYLLAIAFSFWMPEASLIIYILVPLPYIFGWIYRLV